MTNRILYLAPDHTEPSGGVRTIYRHVELLTDAGLDAAVWHYGAGFACEWFPTKAPVVTGPTHAMGAGDLLVVPEVFVLAGVDPAPGCRKVIYNQNHFYTFDNAPADGYVDWQPLPSVWTSSRTSQEVLARLHPRLPVRIVPYSVDHDLFAPAQRRERKVAWMPRKRGREGALLGALFAADERFADVTLISIDGRTEAETAAELATTSVFVALGHEEGFGLPIVEALAAGCAVVGYAAGGGAELFAAPGTYQVTDADVLAIVEQVAALLAAPPSDAERATYRAWTQARYAEDGQRDALLAAVSEASALPGVAGPATHPLATLDTAPAGPSVSELSARIDELTARIAELTADATAVDAERERLHTVAAVLEADLERTLRELGTARRTTNGLTEQLRDLRDEYGRLAGAAERLVHLDETVALLTAYRKDNDLLNARLDDEIRQVIDLRGSTSWRVTAPIRKVTGLLRGGRRG